ncbi:ROK family protein [Metabacillus herbersteinensis]|uniref:ROK family protein n=1 Tax=Metabacillus herbersteinensis TaxID=283816 RepID=A0ABV6GIJ5_9BACI
MNELLLELISTKNTQTRKLKKLYTLIQRYGPIKVETLLEKTSLKPATCARMLEKLTKGKLISGNELGESTGGRKPVLYSINPNVSYVIGIEVTSLFSTILLLNLNLDIRGQIKMKTKNIQSIYVTLDMFITKIEQLLDQHNLKLENILGIGISIDDLFNQTQHMTKPVSAQIDEIQAYIQSKIPTYVTIDSGVNFAALAEHRLHFSTISDRFLFTTCDIEIRSCAITGGNLPYSSPYTTNAFGHVMVDLNGPKCHCGSYGCLHTYSSLDAIKNKIIQFVKRGKFSILLDMVDSVDEIDYYLILKAIEQGDRLCTEVVEDAAFYYGIALSNIILTFQPDTVVCGGTLAPKGSFFDIAKQTAENKIKIYPQLKPTILPAKDSYEIVSQGAGSMVIEHLFT